MAKRAKKVAKATEPVDWPTRLPFLKWSANGAGVIIDLDAEGKFGFACVDGSVIPFNSDPRLAEYEAGRDHTFQGAMKSAASKEALSRAVSDFLNPKNPRSIGINEAVAEMQRAFSQDQPANKERYPWEVVDNVGRRADHPDFCLTVGRLLEIVSAISGVRANRFFPGFADVRAAEEQLYRLPGVLKLKRICEADGEISEWPLNWLTKKRARLSIQEGGNDERVNALTLEQLFRELIDGKSAADGNHLSTLKVDILQFMHENKATSSHPDIRKTCEQIAIGVLGKGADQNTFKLPLSELVSVGFLESQTGRSGGYWLTEAGAKQALLRAGAGPKKQ